LRRCAHGVSLEIGLGITFRFNGFFILKLPQRPEGRILIAGRFAQNPSLHSR
jgi:hypothetical protein